MNVQDFNILFVIWRECIEALLVVGILNAWLSHRPAQEQRTGRIWLWSGVAAGLAGALVLAFLLLTVGDMLSDDAQDYFQTAIVLLAAGLIVQMVFWMRKHGRTLKKELHASLTDVADKANWLGVFALAALAVMREGSEAAVFLYGTMAGISASNYNALVAALIGLAAWKPCPFVECIFPHYRGHASVSRRFTAFDRHRPSHLARRIAAAFRTALEYVRHSV
ncbi:FTR1 family protein [Brucella melitensis F1/06 B10]|nr:FTR1 family protein [Brucella melitensis F1/06 B10]